MGHLKLSLFFGLFFAPLLSWGEGCFERHLKEAIEINERRAALYSDATEGKSYFLSRHLIHFEKLILPLAKIYDKRAKIYQEAGIPLICLDFIEMDQTPSFQPQGAQIPEPALAPTKKEMRQLRRQVFRALRKQGIQAAGDILDRKIQELHYEPHYYCLSRHFLESVLRSARLAPRYRKAAKEKGLRDPTQLIKKLIKLQMRGVVWALNMDKKAIPLQKAGHRLFCQDVPAIPIPKL